MGGQQDQHATNRGQGSGDGREPGFYWVLPIFDVDSDADAWHQKTQPAYWDGSIWVMLGVENEEWQPIWVGERIARPVDGIPVCPAPPRLMDGAGA